MSFAENSSSIAVWAEDAFGPVHDLTVLVDRAQAELDELREALQQDAPPADIQAEAADVAILLHRIAALSGHGDLSQAVDRKMAVNRTRQWEPTGNGTGSHVKPPQEKVAQ